MKIACRSGHTKKSPGSSFILDELTENKKIFEATKKYLKLLDQEVVDVTPKDDVEYPRELNQGIDAANKSKADLFFSIHFNKAYNKEFKEEIGTEVCVYSKLDEAERVLKKLENVIGFKNRGQKIRKDLGELTRTNMKAMIIEVCFVESKGDVDKYKKYSADWIGRQIAEGIVGRDIPASKPKKFKIDCTGMSEERAKEGCEILRKYGNFNCNYSEQ